MNLKRNSTLTSTYALHKFDERNILPDIEFRVQKSYFTEIFTSLYIKCCYTSINFSATNTQNRIRYRRENKLLLSCLTIWIAANISRNKTLRTSKHLAQTQTFWSVSKQFWNSTNSPLVEQDLATWNFQRALGIATRLHSATKFSSLKRANFQRKYFYKACQTSHNTNEIFAFPDSRKSR